MKRFLLTLFLTLGAALADMNVTAFQNGSTWIIEGSDVLRFSVNPLDHTLLIPDVHLSAGASLPAGVTASQTSAGLSLSIPVGTTYVLSPDEKSLILTAPGGQANAPTPAQTGAPLIYRLASADPVLIASTVTNLYPGVRVQVDARQRAVIVVASAQDQPVVLNLIKQLDVPRPQVMFEAEILEVNQDTTQALGMQYDSIFTFKLTEGDTPGLLQLGGLTRSPLSLSIGLNALKTNGAARVLAEPRITTLDGVEATINSTQTTPIIVPGANGAQSVQNITTGITLRMTPRVAPDGSVEATLDITVSTPTGTTSQGVPQFSTRDASTTVRVANGEPIAIGGLLENRVINADQKVPLLGDLPLIGKLFTTSRTETSHTDLIIVVTPRLVGSPNQK